MIEDKLRVVIKAILADFGQSVDMEDILIETPRNTQYGDYATNIAFSLAKVFKKAPKMIAEDISEKINQGEYNGIKANPINGFINFNVPDQMIHEEIINIDDSYGKSDFGKGEKYLVEFVSANPTGPLHIGHGRWAAIGDSVVRMLSEIGFDVASEFYINDAGNQIDKFRGSVDAVRNGQSIDEDGYHGAYVHDLAKIDEDPVKYMLAHQEEVLSGFRCQFDNWFSEKVLHENNMVTDLIDQLKQKGVTYEQEGALWFKTTDFGDSKDRVIIRENGEPTYFAADIAYHFDKYKRGFDHLVDIWGADHHGYIPRVKASIEVLLKDKLAKNEQSVDDVFTVVLGQLVKLIRNGEEVRMSKRTGEMITLSEVIEEIGVDAARYFLAMRTADQMLDFDLDLAKEKSSDNPVYYVQYAHARICSILKKTDVDYGDALISSNLEDAEKILLLKMLRYPLVVKKAALEYSPYILTQYVQELATLFHSFYQKCRVISEDKDVMMRRLSYIDKVRVIISKSLSLVGVTAPESM